MKTTKTTKKIKSTSPFNKFKRSVAVLIAGVMMTATDISITSPSLIADAVDINSVTSMNTNVAEINIKADQYNGHDITDGMYQFDGYTIDFKYSGFQDSQEAAQQQTSQQRDLSTSIRIRTTRFTHTLSKHLRAA